MSGRSKFTDSILPPPSGQQRSADAMPVRYGCLLALTEEALLDNVQLLVIGPIPVATLIGSGKNFDLKAVAKGGHKVRFTIGSIPRSDG